MLAKKSMSRRPVRRDIALVYLCRAGITIDLPR
jgi:hypothetical protein